MRQRLAPSRSLSKAIVKDHTPGLHEAVAGCEGPKPPPTDASVTRVTEGTSTLSPGSVANSPPQPIRRTTDARKTGPRRMRWSVCTFHAAGCLVQSSAVTRRRAAAGNGFSRSGRSECRDPVVPGPPPVGIRRRARAGPYFDHRHDDQLLPTAQGPVREPERAAPDGLPRVGP